MLQLSPYYFRYVDKTVRNYYLHNFQQKKFQYDIFIEMLSRIATFNHMKSNNSSTTNTTRDEEISQLRDFSSFISTYAGLPIMYGVFMQRQHLDPMRVGMKLKLQTGNRSPH